MLLSLEAVSKRYWRGHRVVDVLAEVSFDLVPGEFGAVWGPRSAGKSTLLDIAAGLLEPDAGRVLFDGHDLAGLTTRQRAVLLHTNIGVATRDGPGQRDVPIREWVAMPLFDRVSRRRATRRAHLALERVGVGDIADQPWHDLSDGERTLAAIARALVGEPKLLLVDDPSAGLGLLERGQVAALLRSVADEAGVAVLMTAAELSEIQGARTIWSLGGGRLTGGHAKATATVIDFPARGSSWSG